MTIFLTLSTIRLMIVLNQGFCLYLLWQLQSSASRLLIFLLLVLFIVLDISQKLLLHHRAPLLADSRQMIKQQLSFIIKLFAESIQHQADSLSYLLLQLLEKENNLWQKLNLFLQNIFLLVVLLIILFFINCGLGLFLLADIFLLSACFSYICMSRTFHHKNWLKELEQWLANLSACLNSLPLIQSWGRISPCLSFLLSKFCSVQRQQLKLDTLAIWLQLLLRSHQGLFAIVFFIAMYQGTLLLNQGALLSIIWWQIHSLLLSCIQFGEIWFDFRALQTDLAPQFKPAAEAIAHHTRLSQGAMSLRSFSFSYPSTQQNILCQCQVEIQPGEFVIITGPSNVGKTTLLNALNGTLANSLAYLYFDHWPALYLSKAQRQQFLAVVPQELLLPDVTILQMMRLISRISEQTAWSTLDKVGLAQQIAQFPMGLHTMIGDNGCNLSGGQRRKLILACALIKPAPVLMIDDIFSYLDPKSLQIILNTLLNTKATRLVVTQDPGWLQAADRVFKLDQGRLFTLYPDHHIQ